MTMTTVSTRTRVQLPVMARSMTYVANELERVLQTVVLQRGLSLEHMHRHGATILAGLRTWMVGHYLGAVLLEIYHSRTGRLVERYDLLLDYERHPADEERFRTDLDILTGVLEQRTALDVGYHYRLTVCLADEAPLLPGWASTVLLDASHLAREDIGPLIDTAGARVVLAAWVD